ncbi:flagellar biosynthesis protein FliQ [Thiohalospira sp.]|uniref:flagellar biosynthesis protein FliQ n=1 Tax=Thiohalospira sp. TaxID=3080549 RepID=UPI00397F73A4
MTPEVVLTVFQRALEVILIMLMVTLMPALLTGLLVSMFQAATQINEMTLSFIPKLLVTVLVLIFAGSYLMQLLLDYTERLYGNIPNLIG